MFHNYISKKKALVMLQDGRKGFVMTNVKTKDPDEFILGMINILKLDMNMFNQPSLITNKKTGTYDICFFVKSSVTSSVTHLQLSKLVSNINSVTSCISLEDYIKSIAVSALR